MWFGDLIPGALGIWGSGSQRVGWGPCQYGFYNNQIFFASFTVISHEDSAEFSRGYMCDGVIALPANGFSALGRVRFRVRFRWFRVATVSRPAWETPNRSNDTTVSQTLQR